MIRKIKDGNNNNGAGIDKPSNVTVSGDNESAPALEDNGNQDGAVFTTISTPILIVSLIAATNSL